MSFSYYLPQYNVKNEVHKFNIRGEERRGEERRGEERRGEERRGEERRGEERREEFQWITHWCGGILLFFAQ